MRRRISVAAAALIALAACRKRETPSPSVEIDRSGGSVTIRTAEGTSTAGAVPAIPAGFPKDVPMYPGSHVRAEIEPGNASAMAATFETADWPDDVAKFYAAKLSGWKSMMDMKTEDGHTLLLKSPDGKRTLTLAAKRQALNTVFTLTVSGR